MQPVIVYPPTIDWDYLHQRPQQMLKALAKLGCISVFCNINLHKRYPVGLLELTPNLLLANGQEFSSTIDWARARYPLQPIVTYFTYPPHITQLQLSKTDLIIFDSVDEPVDEFANWLPSYAEAVQKADIVTATARSIADRASAIGKKDIHLLPNGCDYDHFQSAQTKQYIEGKPFNLGKPIIGYIGAIAPWLDMKLVNTMARCLPNYEFVFIGPLLNQNWAAFLNSNMHYLHHKDYSELPRYLSNFSYCLIPFKITEMTKGVNPVKFWEYLASGIPILSTPLPEVPREYSTIITEDLFPGFRPVPAGGRDDRISLARNNSWTKRAQKLLEMIRRQLECG